ncbi:MAG: SCO family protein [Deltaproteobacteria bacterium]|nr:SCO family protein [Deltaproteobacteria bacterium]
MTRRLPGAARASLLAFLLACGPTGEKTYEGVGVVHEVRPDLRQIVIAHEDIPGLMPAMTMSFDVPDVALLSTLTAGQKVRFRVSHPGQSYRIVGAETIGVEGEAGVSGAPAGPTFAGVVAEREPAPSFRLTDQDGRPLALEDLRGKTVVLDFMFTHCTGPCPVLTGLHVDTQRALGRDQRAKTHFVSISLDPERDTPEVLRAYAVKRGVDLSEWSFLTGPPAEVEDVLKGYGVGVIRKAGEEPAHLVATFVIDPQGRIAHRIVGLEQDAMERARLIVETNGRG